MFKHIKPNTANARRFRDTYGGIFFVKAQALLNGVPTVWLNNYDDKEVVVHRMGECVYVSGKLFCEKW